MEEITKAECEARHENLKNIPSDISKIREQIAGLPEALIDKLEKKFASKATESIVYTMVAVICLAVLTALISGVVKAFN